MTLPFPLSQARPVEWLMRTTDSQPPYAVIRRLLKGDPNRPEEWFRVVTWAPGSEERELIGYVRTIDDAATLAWDYKCAFESWRHHLAASRIDAAEMARRQPPAADLVKFYRDRVKGAETAAVSGRG